jgi:hypothetical protein
MQTVFILCAGSGDRWGDYLGVPKQLVTFGDETLIGRIVRLVVERRAGSVYCVTRDLRISLPEHKTLIVHDSDSLTATILATQRYWSRRNVFLLGDVFYSESAMSRTLECQRSLAFLGRPWPSALVKCGHGEMFGLTFCASANHIIQHLLERGRQVRRAGAQANLWNLYQLAGGIPLGSSRYLPSLLVPIDDCTNDIDAPIDFWRRRELYEKICSKRVTD